MNNITSLNKVCALSLDYGENLLDLFPYTVSDNGGLFKCRSSRQLSDVDIERKMDIIYTSPVKALA